MENSIELNYSSDYEMLLKENSTDESSSSSNIKEEIKKNKLKTIFNNLFFDWTRHAMNMQ